MRKFLICIEATCNEFLSVLLAYFLRTLSTGGCKFKLTVKKQSNKRCLLRTERYETYEVAVQNCSKTSCHENIGIFAGKHPP